MICLHVPDVVTSCITLALLKRLANTRYAMIALTKSAVKMMSISMILMIKTIQFFKHDVYFSNPFNEGPQKRSIMK
jgi:hypothetical protein